MEDFEDVLELTAIEAIKWVTEHHSIPSAYALAQSLSDDQLTVQPIQIANYLNGRKMSDKVANRFYDTYGIRITDVYKKTNWMETVKQYEDI